jgi:Rrf2 family nitric oxide-sensitive transcriptional repressor
MMQTRCIYLSREKHAIEMHDIFGRVPIRLTRHTDYALRIMLEAAASPDRRLSIAEVARAHGIPKNNVMKVVNQLANAGMLATVRGRGGGFTLARPADAVTLGEVVRLTEPDLKPADCAGCALSYGCGMEPMLGAAMAAFLAVLDGQTLGEAARRSNFRREEIAALA